MKSTEDEPVESMSLFNEAKAQRLQDKGQSAVSAKRAQQRATQEDREVGDEIVDAVEVMTPTLRR